MKTKLLTHTPFAHILFRLFFVFFIVMGLVLVSPVFLIHVQAQSDLDPIRQQGSTIEQQNQLRTEYRQLLEKYLTLEKEYTLAKQEMWQLGTLASKEKSFQATKSVLIARNELLITYLKLIRLKLIDSHGMSLDSKQETLQSTQEILSEIESFEDTIHAVKNAQELSDLPRQFWEVGSKLVTVSSKINALISTGKLRIVFEKTEILYDELKEKALSTESNLRRAEAERAIQEIDALMITIEQYLDEVDAEVAGVVLVDTEDYYDYDEEYAISTGDSIYPNIIERLNAVYSSLNQVFTYLDELNN